MKFWVVIDGDIGEKGGESLWGQIKQYAGVNLTRLLDKTFVHGDVTEYAFRDIIYYSAKLGRTIQVTTDTAPSE